MKTRPATQQDPLGLTRAGIGEGEPACGLAVERLGRRGDRLLSKRNIGVILFSVRDAVSRDPTTTDLPSGFREVLERMAEIGYDQIGFAGYGQSANAGGGANPGSTNPAAYLA